jgi:hypothetical protein
MTFTLDPDRLAEVMAPDFLLDSGGHKPGERMCELEAVAYVAGEPWTAAPDCASPVLGAFLRSWNDNLDDDTRQTLKPYIPRLVGSRGTEAQEDNRSWMALDWLVRTYTPAWLRLAGLDNQADRLAGLVELGATTDMSSVRPAIDEVRRDAAAAWGVAWDAVCDVAWSVAWSVARAAGQDAARAAGQDAAGDAAYDVAWAAALAAAGDAARGAWAAAQGAWAAWGVARDALQPTVVELQASAHRLVDRMLAVTETVA